MNDLRMQAKGRQNQGLPVSQAIAPPEEVFGLLWGGQMEAAADPPRRPPNQNRRLPNQTNQPTKNHASGVVHFDSTRGGAF